MPRKKSGDSARQDARSAQEAARKAGSDMEPQDRLETLPERLQGAEDAAKEKGASVEELTKLKATFQDMVNLVTSLTSEVGELKKKQLIAPAQAHEKPILCGVCEQALISGGRGVCDGKTHIRVFVYPRNRLFSKGFQGITRNNKTYYGWCLVPPSMADDIGAAIGGWIHHKEMLTYDQGMIREDPWTYIGSAGDGVQAALPVKTIPIAEA